MCLHDTLHAVFYVCWKFSYTSETSDPLTVHLTFLPCEGWQGGRFEKKTRSTGAELAGTQDTFK